MLQPSTFPLRQVRRLHRPGHPRCRSWCPRPRLCCLDVRAESGTALQLAQKPWMEKVTTVGREAYIAEPTNPHRGKRHRVGAITIAHFLQELLLGPATTKDLCQATGMSMITVQRWVRTLHRMNVLHISSWEKNDYGRPVWAAYTLGVGTDASRKIKSNSKRKKEYRARCKVREVRVAMTAPISIDS